MEENKFMGANFKMANKEGDIVFEMKRKNPRRPDGTVDCYYIFQIHEEHMSKQEAVDFRKVFNGQILLSAKLMGIGMFDYTEIAERAHEQYLKMAKSDTIPGEEQVDVEIKIFNHATSNVIDLTIGVSTKKIPKEE